MFKRWMGLMLGQFRKRFGGMRKELAGRVG